MEKRYIKELDASLSPLGFGILRLPMTEDRWFPDSTFELIDQSMRSGVNYYDTGWTYQSGRSEEFAREALVKRYARDSFYLAAKLPVWECRNRGDMERIFQAQLDNLGVEYIDFYLMHGLDIQRWEYGKSIGLTEFLDEKRKRGQIRRMGFSLHDTAENLEKIVDDYSWEFVQLQINYYDWIVLHTKEHYRILEERGIPCITMETVGGGRLSALPKEAQEIYDKVRPGKSASSWAIKFAASLSNVAVMLSGMNTIEQLEDNVLQLSDKKALTTQEKEAIGQVVAIIRSKDSIPCTGCRYCVAECPQKINIPAIFECYNDYKIFGNPGFFDFNYITWSAYPRAEACIKCGKCMRMCPQKIEIPKYMERIRDFAYGRALGFNMEQVKKNLEKRKLICFGSGADGKLAKDIFGGFVEEFCFCDNSEQRWGQNLDGFEIISPRQLLEEYQKKEFLILISSRNYRKPIQKQLLEMGIRKESILNPMD